MKYFGQSLAIASSSLFSNSVHPAEGIPWPLALECTRIPPDCAGSFEFGNMVTSHLPVVPASERSSYLNFPGYFASIRFATAEACL